MSKHHLQMSFTKSFPPESGILLHFIAKLILLKVNLQLFLSQLL